MFIFQIDAGKILQAQTKDEISHSKDTPDTALLKSLSANKPGWVDPGPVIHPPFLPQFPMHVHIDLKHDGTEDYHIMNGKIYHGTEEVNSIPGVDLQKFAEKITEEFEKCRQDPAHQGEKPFPCVVVQFDDDIDGDGNKDYIMADLGVRTMNPPPGTNSIYIPPEKLLGEIIDLSNNLLMDPYHHLGEISKLGKDLAQYTHTEYDLGKADKLFDFFLREKSDLTGDGKIDHNDVIAFWYSLDKLLPHPGPVPLTPQQQINNRPMELD